MPVTYIHIISNIFLIGLICLMDKDVRFWFKNDKKAFLFLCLAVLGSNIIDIDHLLADPIYDPGRCSINFHPLHSWYTMPLWIVGAFLKNKYIKYFCLGVLLHLLLDCIDCLLMS